MELYIHIPFCVKKCDYCDFLSGPYEVAEREAYTHALCSELEFYAERFGEEMFDTVFIGGGTPSWLELNLMDKVMSTLRRMYRLSPKAEFTVECNPGTLTKEALRMYKSYGVNRLSIGCQSANNDELVMLGRIHTFENFIATYEHAREEGFENINVDIMTGLPNQTPDKLISTLDAVTRLKPEHISAYALTIEEGTPFAERYSFDLKMRKSGLHTRDLPDEDEEYELGKITQRFLIEKGYPQYEISNYAKPGFECRHNIGYWRRVPYLGVGIGAASFYDSKRYKNISDIFDYIKKAPSMNVPLWESITELSRHDEISEYMYLGLRMNEGIKRIEFERTFNMSIEALYQQVLLKLKREELITAREGRIFLTERGMDLGNYVFSQFLL